VILVSHDRFFLDAVVTRITDLNLRKLTITPATTRTTWLERDARMERCASRSASRTKKSRA
jgi:ATPase subunit of ABC transporter with duplicated ATPase domains